ncbi:hypothetical protein P3T40_007860 [Paraburkholderia sp. EB58]|jgi:hypothetical protein
MHRSMTGGLAAVTLSVICSCAFAQNAPAGPTVIGNAVVVVGHASLEEAHRHAPLARGDAIAQGSTIETGADGYVYITTVDQGFISVRPNSSLTVERYEYDPTAPERTVIKLVLHKGIVREISGKGAQAAREHYRMNTPVAALGVRGTDFSVFTDSNVTRAEVRSGGIVMTPLGEGCAATGIGPCETPAAVQLFATQRNALLQLNRGSARPIVIEAKHSQLVPDPAAQAQKNEDNTARAAAASAASTPAAQAPVDPGVAPVELTFPLSPPASSTPPATSTSPSQPTQPAQPPETQQIFWGRFEPLASAPATTTITALVQQGSEQVGTAGPYAMTRTPQPDMVMPASGSIKFTLQFAEAYVINSTTGQASAATISNPMLCITFGANTFTTSLTATANGVNYAIKGQGAIQVNTNGKLASDYTSQAIIAGALAGKNATQAGYVFSQSFNGKNTVVGATLWSR